MAQFIRNFANWATIGAPIATSEAVHGEIVEPRGDLVE